MGNISEDTCRPRRRKGYMCGRLQSGEPCVSERKQVGSLGKGWVSTRLLCMSLCVFTCLCVCLYVSVSLYVSLRVCVRVCLYLDVALCVSMCTRVCEGGTGDPTKRVGNQSLTPYKRFIIYLRLRL